MRTPVFIVGAPRSGTTLLREILNRHPELAVCGETNFFHRIYMRRRFFGDLADPRNRARAVDAYLATHVARRLRMEPEMLRERLMREALSCREFFVTLMSTFADLNGKKYGGEKTPWHSLYAKTLLEWFPSCSIIHLVRDPRDAVASLITMPWESRSVLAGARVWQRFNAASRTASRAGNYLQLKYEDLVSEPEQELRRLCEHIGLEWSTEMMQPPDDATEVLWWSRRAHRGITSARIASWRRHLRPWQVSIIESTCGSLMEELGYPRQAAPASLIDRSRAAAEAAVEISLQKLFRAPSVLSRFFRPTNLASEEKWRERATELYGRVRPHAHAGSERS